MLEAVLAVINTVLDLVGLSRESARRKQQLRVSLSPIEEQLRTVLATVPLTLTEHDRVELRSRAEALHKLIALLQKTGKVPSHAELEGLVHSLRSFAEQSPTYSTTFTLLNHARQVSGSLA